MIQLSDRNSKTKATNGFQFYKGIMTAKWLPDTGFDKRVSSVQWKLNSVIIQDILNQPPKYNTEITYYQSLLGASVIECTIVLDDATEITEFIEYTCINPPA